MKDDEVYEFVKSDKNNDKKGSVLKKHDFEFLAYLAKHRVLLQEQTKKIYNFYNKSNKDTLRKKLAKWGYEGILYSKDLSKKTEDEFGNVKKSHNTGKHFKVNSIGNLGKNTLIQKGYLSDSWLKRDIRENAKVKTIDHFLGTQEVVLNTYINLKDKGYDVESIRPSNVKLDFMSEKYDESARIPDWVMKLGNRTLFIEVDMGTMNHEFLKDKMKGYISYCKQTPEKEFMLLYVLHDGSVRTFNKSTKKNGPVRLSNMKGSISSVVENLPNLSVHAIHLSASHKLAEKLLIGEKSIEEMEKEDFMLKYQPIKILMEGHRGFEYNYKSIDPNQVYPNYFPKNFYSNDIYKLTNKAGTHSEIVIFTNMEYGNLYSYSRLFKLSNFLKDQLYKMKVDKVIAYYPSMIERELDVLDEFPSNVLFADPDTWLQDVSKDPLFYRSTSKSGVREVKFEDE